MMNQEIKIKKLLKRLGITPELKGYHFLTEAITIKAIAGNSIRKTQGCINREIAEKFETTSWRVERAIRYAIELAVIRKTSTYTRIFGAERVTTNCFIASIVEYINSPESEA